MRCPDPLNHVMQSALILAHEASALGEVPVGAVISHRGKIIASAHNLVETHQDPTAHAEQLCIQAACKALSDKYLKGCTIYVTLEPCAMCAMAISHARIDRLVFGAYDPKSGGVEHGSRVFDHPQTHHKPEVIGGIEEQKCTELLEAFFKTKR